MSFPVMPFDEIPDIHTLTDDQLPMHPGVLALIRSTSCERALSRFALTDPFLAHQLREMNQWSHRRRQHVRYGFGPAQI